jgi:hypothetical protein
MLGSCRTTRRATQIIILLTSSINMVNPFTVYYFLTIFI